MTTERVRFASTDGLQLEGELEAPREAHAALVLCHPHPKMGGTMNAPLLGALCGALVPRGWAVLRFNFRGIGSSEGDPSLGEDEVADALGAVALTRQRFSRLPVGIAGWSFGGAVAIRAAIEDDSLVGCVGIAPAVTRREDVAAGLPPATELDLGVRLLVVCGARDKVVGPGECRAWIAPIEAATYVELPGANHFFWGKYDELAATVADWLDDLV